VGISRGRARGIPTAAYGEILMAIDISEDRNRLLLFHRPDGIKERTLASQLGSDTPKKAQRSAFAVAGYRSGSSYAARTPDWEPDLSYTSITDAIDAALVWTSDQGPESYAEVMLVYERSGSQSGVRAA
jgi:hypothetical protein